MTATRTAPGRRWLITAVAAGMGAAGLLAGGTAAPFQLTAHEPGEISGPCDEPEHLDDPRCVTVSVPDTGAPVGDDNPTGDDTGTPVGDDNPNGDAPGDVSGPCDEPEHAGDPRCGPVGTPTGPTGEPTPASPPATDGPRTVDAAGAGTVTYTFDGSTFTLISADPAPGWSVEVEQAAGAEIDVDFRSGTRRVQVDIEVDDGAVRERVRIRDRADDSETRIVNGTVTRIEPAPADEDHADDDHDDEDHAEDHDDNRGRGRGRGRGGDDHHDDDHDEDHDEDRSGSNSGQG